MGSTSALHPQLLLLATAERMQLCPRNYWLSPQGNEAQGGNNCQLRVVDRDQATLPLDTFSTGLLLAYMSLAVFSLQCSTQRT